MLPDITKGSRPEKGIHYGMEQHIRIRVAEKPSLIRDLNSSKDKLPVFHYAVYIIS